MKLGELINALSDMRDLHGDDIPVVFNSNNSAYADDIITIFEGYGVRSFYGRDYKALVLSGSQCGAMWEEYDLDLEYEEDCDID